jgi:hypothetical protein
VIHKRYYLDGWINQSIIGQQPDVKTSCQHDTFYLFVATSYKWQWEKALLFFLSCRHPTVQYTTTVAREELAGCYFEVVEHDVGVEGPNYNNSSTGTPTKLVAHTECTVRYDSIRRSSVS